MSSSQGNPSNKDKWYKSMCAKLDYANGITEEAKRSLKSKNYKPRFKEGKKANKLFADNLEEQKVIESKRNKKDYRTNNKKDKNHE
jgi:hypothetical protein